MYVPEYASQRDPEKIRELIRKHPFATVITEGLMVSHLPILLDETDPAHPLLIGHLARANPQARDFEAGREALVIFHGPNSYVSPRWYEGELNVPTWSYAVVHVRGKSRPATGQRLVEILDRSTKKFEAEVGTGTERPWSFSGNPDLPAEFREQLARAILGFEIEMTHVEAKFKLSQNRDPADYRRVREALAGMPDEMSRALLALMPETLAPEKSRTEK